MAVEILFDAIHTYVYPLLDACGLSVDPYGYIIDQAGGKLAMKNPKYAEGDNVEEVSPVLYPVIPLRDDDYLEIKEKPELELFNPFMNIKHAILIAVKIKKLAVTDLSPALLKTAIDEDDWDKFDDYVGLSNDTNMNGDIDYALVDMSLPNKPEIVRYPCPVNDPIKGLWALCVLVYNKYVTQRPPYLKQFQDIDKSWKKIIAAMHKWDKLRKTIVSNIHKEENTTMNVDYMDLSEGIAPGEAINVYNMPHILTGDDFLMTDDGNDINDGNLQNYLTSLFDKEDLKPYEEPVESDEQVHTIVTKITEPEQPSMVETVKEQAKKTGVSFTEMKPVNDEPAPVVKQPEPPVKVQVPATETPKKTVFKIKANPTNTNQQNLGFNNPGMYGNMFGMGGYGYGYQNMQRPSMNMDDMMLGDCINPFSSYQ